MWLRGYYLVGLPRLQMFDHVLQLAIVLFRIPAVPR